MRRLYRQHYSVTTTVYVLTTEYLSAYRPVVFLSHVTLCEESSVITIRAEYSLSGGDDNTMEEKDLRKRKVDVSFSTKVSKPGVS